MTQPQDYSKWSHEQLQDRLKLLDKKIEQLEVQMANAPVNPTRRDVPNQKMPDKRRIERDLDPSKYSTRLIALKLAYLGKNYNGFEYHSNNKTPLPTVEETLWKALMKTRLIFPTRNPNIENGEPNFGGCEYSKSGRTDKGVSAFGQVIGIRVRSNRPLSRASTPSDAQSKKVGSEEDDDESDTHQVEILATSALKQDEVAKKKTFSTFPLLLDDETTSFHPIDDELPYCQMINRVLPPDIRILAWCPDPPLDFSARFSCRERHYAYFFTQPAFTPTPGVLATSRAGSNGKYEARRPGYLDISAMQAAAKKFEGTHDFRNFCKVDPSKQIDNFKRRIFHASIVEQNSSDNQSISNVPVSYVSDPAFQEFANPNSDPVDLPSPSPEPASQALHANTSSSYPHPKIYAFHLHGSAFLWHQVRHMVAILFLIGQGLEPLSLIDDLLDTSKNPGKPMYEMADGIPLVLSNCIFPSEGAGAVDPDIGRAKDAMEWLYVGNDGGGDPQLSLRENRLARQASGRYGLGGVVDELWKVWRGSKIDEILAGRLLDVVARQGIHSEAALEEGRQEGDNYADDTGGMAGALLTGDKNGLNGIPVGNGLRHKEKSSPSQQVFRGADGVRIMGVYVSVLKKPRMEPVEVINERYLEKKRMEEEKGRW